VSDVAAFDFSRVDLAFFCGRAALSERYAEAAAAHAWVIDGSAAFGRARMCRWWRRMSTPTLWMPSHTGLIALPGVPAWRSPPCSRRCTPSRPRARRRGNLSSGVGSGRAAHG